MNAHSRRLIRRHTTWQETGKFIDRGKKRLMETVAVRDKCKIATNKRRKKP